MNKELYLRVELQENGLLTLVASSAFGKGYFKKHTDLTRAKLEETALAELRKAFGGQSDEEGS